MVTLGELAAHLMLPLGAADPAIILEGIAPLARAGGGQLAFVADKKYLADLPHTRAACVITRADWAAGCPVPVLYSEDPYLAYARASSLFEVAPQAEPGIHPTAVVHAEAVLGPGVSIGAGAHVDRGVRLGAGAVVGSGVSLGANAQIGDRTRIAPNVVIYHEVIIGADCLIHACTVIGSDGFGFARRADGWQKIHQLGRVVVGDRVEIGAGATIDRGALGDTLIANDVIIDNQVHIAHNCSIGERTAIAGCVGMAGSTEIGADCTFAGQVGVSGHLKICDNAHFTGQARVARSVSEPGTYASGTPLEPSRQWGRNAVRFGQLDALHRRVVELETALANQLAAGAGTGASKSSRDGGRAASSDAGETVGKN